MDRFYPPLQLVIFLLLSTRSLEVASKTFPGDTAALKAMKRAINPSSIPPGSCLSSWDFSVDPCDAAFGDRFTCGLRCDVETSGLRRVTELALDSAGYAGSLSPAVWSLSYLESLDLADNRFTGPIPSPPPSSGLPSSLRRLTLSRNSFSGQIPTLSPASALEELYLENNFLTGQIPASLTELRSLKRVELQGNNFTGEIPDLSGQNSLYYLDASDNALTGGFPSGLPPSLVEVSLRNNNLGGFLSGTEVSALPALQVLDLSGNALSGAVPGAVFQHPSLEQLNLGGNRFNSVENPVGGGTGRILIALDLAHNQLRGMLPSFLGEMPRLSALSLEHNQFTGMIPAAYAVRAAGSGGLEGAVPFVRLLLAGNYLFGPVPSALGMMKEGTATISLADNCLFRCPPEFFVCQGGEQKPSATCREFNPVIP